MKFVIFFVFFYCMLRDEGFICRCSQISNPFCYSWQILGFQRLVSLTAQMTYQVFQSAVLISLGMMNQKVNLQWKENSAKSNQLWARLIIWHPRYFLAWDMVCNLSADIFYERIMFFISFVLLSSLLSLQVQPQIGGLWVLFYLSCL